MEFIFFRIIITILNMKQKRKYSLKFPQIEVFGIAILWILIFSIPLIMKLSNHAADWDTVIKPWIKISTFFLVFLINIYVFIPHYLKKKKYGMYTLWLIVITPIIIYLSLKCDSLCLTNNKSGMPPMEIGPGMPPMELSENMPIPEGLKLPSLNNPPSKNIIFLQQLLIAFLVIGTGAAYKVILFWKEEERQNKILQQQIADENREIDEYIFVKANLSIVKILISDILYLDSTNKCNFLRA